MFLEEVVFELKHLNALMRLVIKRGLIEEEVKDLRKRINAYINSIPSSENIEASAEIRQLLGVLTSF